MAAILVRIRGLSCRMGLMKRLIPLLLVVVLGLVGCN